MILKQILFRKNPDRGVTLSFQKKTNKIHEVVDCELWLFIILNGSNTYSLNAVAEYGFMYRLWNLVSDRLAPRSRFE